MSKLDKKYLVLEIEYFFCFFSLISLPSIYELTGETYGIVRYFYIFYLASFFLVSLRTLMFTKKTNSKLVKLISFIVLIFTLHLISDGLIELSINSLMQNWPSYRYFFSAYLFLTYFYFLSSLKPARALSTIANCFFLNLVIWLFLLGTFTQFSGGLLYTYAQQEANKWYNGYLLIGDTLLFLSLGFVVSSKNYISLLFSYLSLVSIFLIGSRASVFPALLSSGLLTTFFLIKFFNEGSFFIKSFVRYLNLILKRWFLVLIFIAIGTFVFVYFPIFERFSQVYNLQNLYQSRVYETIFTNSSLTYDSSFNERYFGFQCFKENVLPYPEKLLLGTDSNMGCNRINYLHSSFSILVDLGLIGFMPFVYLIFLTLKKIIKSYVIFNLEGIMLIVFLILSFSSRTGFGFLLPTLTFSYSILWINRNKTIAETYLVLSKPDYAGLKKL